MEPCNPHHLPAPGERATGDLSAEELFVVGSLRAWVSPLMRPGTPCPDWKEIFRLAAVGGEASAGFDRLMSIIGTSAQRIIEVRCCSCPSLGADEVNMLHLVAALQMADRTGAIDIIADWVAPAFVAAALRGAEQFAAGTMEAALWLPPQTALPAPARRPEGALLH
ncbi:hypothetical protein [Roseococcus sp. YIM B11640]|uniref:hypothetical protein n=1 Tax=Roseococcus sp. YIM B11640 TaxID=3133973 RepID=UPI003C7CBDF0